MRRGRRNIIGNAGELIARRLLPFGSINSSVETGCVPALLPFCSPVSASEPGLVPESSTHLAHPQMLVSRPQPNVTPTLFSSPQNTRNAGRKKTNPVWDFFTDLKARGLPGVRCRYCEWITNDRSPTTLKFHLKRKHDTGPGGIWSIVEERINLHTPQYKAARAAAAAAAAAVAASHGTERTLFEEEFHYGSTTGSSSVASSGVANDDTLRTLPGARAVIEATPSSSQQHALDQLIMKSSQAFIHSNTYEHDNVFDTNESTRNQSRPPSRVIGSTGERIKQHSSHQQIVDGGAVGSYVLSDGQNIGELLRVASDMDLTFSFNSRKHCEYCFESNAPEMKGKVVVFVDFGDRVSVTVRHQGCDQSTEEWKKADWKQFLWAVRGKCMNTLKNS